MVSVYGYITVANLEAFAIEDYSAIDARYTDAAIEAQITQAERDINTFCHQTFTGTIPDAIVGVCLELAMRMMVKRMVKDEWLDITKIHINTNTDIQSDPAMVAKLAQYIHQEIDDGPDIIPMSRSWRNR